MKLYNYFWQYLIAVIWALVLALIFYFPERFAPAEKNQPDSSRIFNLLYTPVLIAVIFLLEPIVGLINSRALLLTGGGLLPVLVDSESGLAAHVAYALGFALVWDIWQYWIHRLQHTNPFLWQTHKFHHSDTALNATTQTRHHGLNALLFIVSYFPVLLLFGSQELHFIAFFVLFRLWGFVNHANIRINLGPLTPFVAGPQWHRIHHSARTEHLGRNYATFFPILDILFGTYYAPHRDEYPPTGLIFEEPTSDLRESTVAPLIAWRTMASKQLQKRQLNNRSEIFETGSIDR